MRLPKRVVVIADDFGYCSCRSSGIAECSAFLSGTSVLVTHISASSSCSSSSASSSSPSFAVPSDCWLGLHLNLTEGSPLCLDACSLLDPSSRSMRGREGLRSAAALRLLEPAHVRQEIEAQIAAFRNIFGRLPAHVDGHNHAHLVPVVATELAAVLHSLGPGTIWTRIPRQNLGNATWNISEASAKFFDELQKECKIAAPIFDAHQVPYRKAFIGLTTQGDLGSFERVMQAFQDAALIDDCCEWMVHPGHACLIESHKGDDFSKSKDRDTELNLIKAVCLELQKRGVKIVKNEKE